MRWVLDMQSDNGGWAAFDVDNIYDYLNNIPFADSVLEILDSEGIKSYRLIPYTYTVSISGSINAAFGIQFNLNADEEQDLYKGGIKKELTGVS